ncbi:DinB family protein [Amycolatopsis sp., V23-08]|uniref:DinB family protein n=1 Tax=Amycolatopsis heterodermiae TaxID=3110235 RepID=A0ABU5RJR6_9PSEU|nr:DinB family protein [Amycolatopsis sp., V23-08]MEA5366527.1 DinB family protein [Amycolatopsis sp., V23-08]
MTIVDEQGRAEPPVDADETGTLLGFLEYHRATLAWKCAGLDAAGLRATVGPSPLTLGGMLKHLSYVEDHWFSRVLTGAERAEPWNSVDWAAAPDWDWDSAVEDTPDQLRELWEGTVARSRELLTKALEQGDLSQVAARGWADGRKPNLRWILVHMVEEYSRHNGHADLIRESVDGSTGE